MIKLHLNVIYINAETKIRPEKRGCDYAHSALTNQHRQFHKASGVDNILDTQIASASDSK